MTRGQTPGSDPRTGPGGTALGSSRRLVLAAGRTESSLRMTPGVRPRTGGDVRLTELGVDREEHRRRVHLARSRALVEGQALGARGTPTPSCARSRASEVDADPDVSALVLEEVHRRSRASRPRSPRPSPARTRPSKRRSTPAADAVPPLDLARLRARGRRA